MKAHAAETPANAEREAFEEWFRNDCPSYVSEGDAYDIWQAAIAAVKEGDSVWDQQFCTRMYKLPED